MFYVIKITWCHVELIQPLRFHCGVMSPYPTCLAVIPPQTTTMKKPAARAALAPMLPSSRGKLPNLLSILPLVVNALPWWTLLPARRVTETTGNIEACSATLCRAPLVSQVSAGAVSHCHGLHCCCLAMTLPLTVDKRWSPCNPPVHSKSLQIFFCSVSPPS